MSKKTVTNTDYRNFGIAFTVFLSLVSTFILWRHEWSLTTVNSVLYGLAALFLLTALFLPGSLKPVFRGWMVLARALGWLNTHILLSLIYYFMFGPISLAIRLFGGDLLKQKIDRDQQNFWVDKNEVPQNLERYQKQF